MKRIVLLFTLIISVLILQTACNQSNKEVTLEDVGLSSDTLALAGKKMQEYIDNGKLAGISTLIYKNGKTVYRKNFGVARLNDQKPLENDAIFRIFSMTKPITAVALMTLYDQGKFQLDDKVSDYIPEFKGTQVYNPVTKTTEPQVQEVTIRHLLTHTSGIPYGWDQKAYVDSLYRVTGVGGWDGTIGEKVKQLAGLPLKNQPGTKWEYGLSIDVAGYLVEVLSGKPLDEYFKTTIFDPLKMDDTGFYVPEEKHNRFSDVFSVAGGKLSGAQGRMSEAFKSPVTLFSGGGGLISTIDDYTRFCRMLLNGGELDGNRILKESTVNMIMSNQLPAGVTYNEKEGYGLAGTVNLTTGEYGWAGAASTKFWINPQEKMIVLAFAQLMPNDFSFADDFKKIVDRAVME